MDFDSIRKEYESTPLVAAEFPADPITLFDAWYKAAVDNLPGKWFEPNAMALATSDTSGRVSVRYVLLKGVQPEGIRFYTNYDSDKGKQLAANPNCSVAFHWPYLGRQLRIEGIAEKTSREDSEKYFHSRPRGSQIGAAASQQSAAIKSRTVLEQNRERMTDEFGDAPVPLPDNWGGYLIRANRFEFWQGRRDRLHDRLAYVRDADKWSIKRLSP